MAKYFLNTVTTTNHGKALSVELLHELALNDIDESSVLKYHMIRGKTGTKWTQIMNAFQIWTVLQGSQTSVALMFTHTTEKVLW